MRLALDALARLAFDGRLGCCFDVPRARCHQGLLQALETDVLGMQAFQIGSGLVAGRQAIDDRARLVDAWLMVDQLAHALRVETATARVAGIFQGGEADADLMIGQNFGRCTGSWSRGHIEGGGVEAEIGGLLHFGDQRRAPHRQAAGRRPDGTAIALVEGCKGGTVLACGAINGRCDASEHAAHLDDGGIGCGVAGRWCRLSNRFRRSRSHRDRLGDLRRRQRIGGGGGQGDGFGSCVDRSRGSNNWSRNDSFGGGWLCGDRCR